MVSEGKLAHSFSELKRGGRQYAIGISDNNANSEVRS